MKFDLNAIVRSAYRRHADAMRAYEDAVAELARCDEAYARIREQIRERDGYHTVNTTVNFAVALANRHVGQPMYFETYGHVDRETGEGTIVFKLMRPQTAFAGSP